MDDNSMNDNLSDDSYDDFFRHDSAYHTYTKLMYKWTWYYSAPTGRYGELIQVSDFSTAEGFWSIYNNVSSLHSQIPGSKYFLMKTNGGIPAAAEWPNGGKLYKKCMSEEDCKTVMLECIRGAHPIEAIQLTKREEHVVGVCWTSFPVDIPGMRYISNDEKIIGPVCI